MGRASSSRSLEIWSPAAAAGVGYAELVSRRERGALTVRSIPPLLRVWHGDQLLFLPQDALPAR